MRRLTIALAICLFAASATAETLDVQPVANGIWALEGPAEQRNAGNLGNNATFGLIETPKGAVLVDPGGTWEGAKALHAVVKTLTQQPVRYVINTGGQDHRWLGNGYWQAQGAQVIASTAAVADQEARGSMQLTMLSNLVGDGLAGTEPAYADVTFESSYTLELGGVTFELRHPASAHTPGDSFVWLPASKTVFTGDIVYVGRVLGIMAFSNSADWLEAFAAIEALKPVHLVPGHGPLTTLETAQRDTRDYIANLRDKIGAHIDEGGDIIGAPKVDQSAFAYLAQFDSLAGRNAQSVFEQMEWE